MLERETLHIMDDKRRIALVETLTTGCGCAGSVPEPVMRYQLSNHLSSASLALDKVGGLISYEEYTPYGSTVYQAGRSAAEVKRKRYRYTGKEKDEENGFSYHGARYYAPWLGRWTAADPSGLASALNLYIYVSANPVIAVDSTGYDDDKIVDQSDKYGGTSAPGGAPLPPAAAPAPNAGETPSDTAEPPGAKRSPGPMPDTAPAPTPPASATASPAPASPPPSAPPSPTETSESYIPDLSQNELDTLHVPNLASQGFRNPYAQVLAAQGKTHLAVVWESGFICSACHLTHFSEGSNEDINLHVFAYQVQVAAYAKAGAMLLQAVTYIGGARTGSRPPPLEGGGAEDTAAPSPSRPLPWFESYAE
jgi:RHS repeat-associated protein